MDVAVRPRAAAPLPLEQVWTWLANVMDPEIPVLSVVDLGIIRAVRWQGTGEDAELVVTYTPTYSGCPAVEMINADILTVLEAHGLARVRLERQLSPAWTTDWLTATGRQRMEAYGIAPPACDSCVARQIAIGMARRAPKARLAVRCPHCGSRHTHVVSAAGSTRCKALYACDDCREPFDYFKPH